MAIAPLDAQGERYFHSSLPEGAIFAGIYKCQGVTATEVRQCYP
jgi:hypothetical protein